MKPQHKENKKWEKKQNGSVFKWCNLMPSGTERERKWKVYVRAVVREAWREGRRRRAKRLGKGWGWVQSRGCPFNRDLGEGCISQAFGTLSGVMEERSTKWLWGTGTIKDPTLGGEGLRDWAISGKRHLCLRQVVTACRGRWLLTWVWNLGGRSPGAEKHLATQGTAWAGVPTLPGYGGEDVKLEGGWGRA